MNSGDLESVKATIAKLITLANNEGATENEARVAMERATRLMAKHNLNQAEVMMQKVSAGEKLSAVNESADCYYHEASYNWEYKLGWGLAPIFECKGVRSADHDWTEVINGNKKRPTKTYSMAFIGLPEDVALVLYFFDYCQDEVGNQMELTKFGKRQQNDFALGMVYRILERLEEMYAKVAEEIEGSTTCTALIVVKKDAVSERVEQDFPKLKNAPPSKRDIDYGAFMQGRAAGDRVHLGSNRKQVH